MEQQTSKKQFTYRGKTIEELKTLSIREFAEFLNARERRTAIRQFQEIEKFVNRLKEKDRKGKKIRTHNRDIIIVPELVGMKISVYNGNQFVPFDVTGEMLGHRLGEFALTRGKIKHSKAGVGATKGSKHKAKK
ncbi:MAG: 30S ribosomal protein S19 [Candidatus Pacearchaeota archaeon]|jgi:small subunit ribosomal protein S19